MPSKNLTPSPHRVPSFDGTLLAYDFYDAGSTALALVVPGFWRDRRHPSMQTLAALIAQTGCSVAVVDCRGHGESEGVYGFNRFESEDVAVITREILAHHPEIEAIDLVGLSMGGAIAVSTAATHREFPWRSMLLISAVAEFSAIVPKINLLTFHHHIAWSQALRRPRFDWRLRRSEKRKAVDDIRELTIPICLVHMEDDWLIGHRHSEMLHAAAAGPKELHVLRQPGQFHADRLLEKAGDETRRIILDFLGRQNEKAALSRG